jgi:type I restriction enzyme R subunit
MAYRFTESVVEEAALEWFEATGYHVLSGPLLGPGQEASERETCDDVVLFARFRDALARLNPHAGHEALEEAFRKVTRISAPQIIDANHQFHDYLVNGVPTEFMRADGTVGYEAIRLVDYERLENNDWLTLNQFTVTEAGRNCRPDVVVFVNGLPLAIIELKNTVSDANIGDAFTQLQRYKTEIPSFFTFNAVMVISDGSKARVGAISSDFERYSPWRTADGETTAPTNRMELEILIKGLFDHRRFVDLIRYYTLFEDRRESPIKKVAGYHQFFAVERAIEATITASRPDGDKRAGVVWHTQGSGKSLSMVFLSGRLATHAAMQNPTLVVLTDRNDLDEQLFDTFSNCQSLLRQAPKNARNRAHLREILKVASGGIVFTTIQKFLPAGNADGFPLLSDRRNIVVIADEAHRSQYDFVDGFARHIREALPNASFIGFTGTPIETADKNTRAVFGEYISVYDIQRAVDDGATVPIFYHSRLAKLHLDQDERARLDDEFDEVTEGEESEGKDKLKSKWSALEAVVGTQKRVQQLAADIVEHFEERCETLVGKGMIVCMSRRICVDLYNAIVALKPDWHDDDDDKGVVKIVMTGGPKDPASWEPHTRSKQRREKLADRMRDPKDSLRLVIVRDMWLTGFDAPCVHTMYIDKPMQGHGLMQAIARVNRVFSNKPGGLIVDYIGLADPLKKALQTYTDSGGTGQTAIDQDVAVTEMLKRHEICLAMFHGFDLSARNAEKPSERATFMQAAFDHILQQDKGKERFVESVSAFTKAFALAVPRPETMQVRDDLCLFQQMRAWFLKSDTTVRTPTQFDLAIRQIVSSAVVSEGIVDIFAAVGLDRPDVSILSDAFLDDVRKMKHKNLAFEVLRKLLNDEIASRSKNNVVQSKKFSEMLDQAVARYQNRQITVAEILDEVIAMSKDFRESLARGEKLNLTSDEIAFYDALEVNDSAVKILGDEVLKTIARDLVATIRRNVTLDWKAKESVRAKLRLAVKKILKFHGYPPDKQESATLTVLQQAEVLSDGWAGVT